MSLRASAAAAAFAILLALIVAYFATRQSTEPESPASPREVAEAGPADPPSVPRLAPSPADAGLAEGDTERVEIEARPRKLLELEILDPYGQPARGARIVLVEASGEWRSARTDERGRASFEPRPGTAELLVALEHSHPHRQTLDVAAGSRRIQVPPGLAVSGRVRLDGAAPDPAIELTLKSDRRSFTDLGLAPQARDLLGLDRKGCFQASCATDSHGTFAFAGLSVDWSGEIVLPPGYTLAHEFRAGFGERRVPLDEPTMGLLLDIERLPRLVGRVVDAATRVPVADEFVTCYLTWSDGGSMASAQRTGPDGRFEVVLRESRFRSVLIDVVASAGQARLELTREEVGDDLDVGDVELTRGSTLAVRTLDPTGAPIAGAVAQVKGRRRRPSARTDADGRGVLDDLGDDAQTLIVVASGFQVTEALIPRPLPHELEIVLRPANRLTVTVKGPAGSPVPGISIEIGCGAVELFPGQGWQPRTALGSAAGSWLTSIHNMDGTVRSRFMTNDEGTLVLEGLVSGQPLSLAVLDPLGVVVHQTQIAPLGSEERREVDLILSDAGRALAGVVRDDEGNPLAGVAIYLMAGRDAASDWTGDDGRFRFRSLHAPRVSVLAEKEGYAKAIRDDYDLARDGSELELVLVRGRRVLVEVVDVHGNPVEGGQVTAVRPGQAGSWQSRANGTGLLRLDDVPPEILALTLELAGRRYELDHDARIATARFEVPVHGRLNVAWKLAPDQAVVRTYVVVRSSDPALVPLQEPLGATEGSHTFPSVLPGTYEVALTRSERLREPRIVLASSSITVVAGQTATLELAP